MAVFRQLPLVAVVKGLSFHLPKEDWWSSWFVSLRMRAPMKKVDSISISYSMDWCYLPTICNLWAVEWLIPKHLLLHSVIKQLRLCNILNKCWALFVRRPRLIEGVIEWVFNHVGIRLTTNGKLGLYKISLRPGHRIALSNNPTVQCDEHAPHRPIHMAIHDNHVWKNRQLDFGNLPITSYYCSNRSAYLCTTVTYIETCRNSLSPKVRQGIRSFAPKHYK